MQQQRIDALARQLLLDRYFESHEQLRSIPTAVASSLLFLGMALLPAIPGAGTILRTPLWATLTWIGIFLPWMWMLVALRFTVGVRSRWYLSLNFGETILFATGSALLAASTGSMGSYWWLLYLAVLAYVAATEGKLFWVNFVTFALTPPLVGVLLAWQRQSIVPLFEAAGILVMALLLFAHLARATERAAQLEAERAELHAELARLQVEKERARIADELHDGLGAHLTSIALAAEAGGRHSAQPPALLEEIASTARRATTELRAAVWAARNAEETWSALTVHLKLVAADLCRPHGVSLEFHSEGEITPTIALRQQLLRIVQEGVQNALKHGRPTRLAIRIGAAARVTIELLDDGPGIPTDAISRGGGIAGMARRAHALGGSLELGPGGRLFVELPARAPSAASSAPDRAATTSAGAAHPMNVGGSDSARRDTLGSNGASRVPGR